MTTDRKIFDFLPRRGIMAKIEYPGIAKLVARVVWECRGGIRDRVRRNAAKPCDTCVCRIFPDCRKRHKSGFDHMNDHRQKKLWFSPLAVVSWQKSEYPGIAKLVSRLVWEQDVGSSSLLSRTKMCWWKIQRRKHRTKARCFHIFTATFQFKKLEKQDFRTTSFSPRQATF